MTKEELLKLPMPFATQLAVMDPFYLANGELFKLTGCLCCKLLQPFTKMDPRFSCFASCSQGEPDAKLAEEEDSSRHP